MCMHAQCTHTPTDAGKFEVSAPLPVLLPADLPNYFDADEGYVPDGFGNSVGDPSCDIVDDGVEFAYEGHSNRFTVDLDPTGLITLTGDAAGDMQWRVVCVKVQG